MLQELAEGRNSLLHVPGPQGTAWVVPGRAKLATGRPGGAFTEIWREKLGVMVHVMPANPGEPEAGECLRAAVTPEYSKVCS